MTDALALGSLGQISRTVRDIDAAVAFYRDVLGLRHLFTAGEFAFFDLDGVRLFLSASEEGTGIGNSVLYFRVDDIHTAHALLVARDVVFRREPHLIHRHPSGVEEWMAFFDDPDGGVLALMSSVAPPA